MFCHTVPAAFKMRSIQFISCSAMTRGGGFHLEPAKQTAPNETIYCYFLFFHECKCLANVPYGHDIAYADHYSLYLESGNPFKECYTTNADDRRMFYEHYDGTNWIHKHTEKWNWLKRGILNRFVAVSGGSTEELCGLDESSACRTICVAVSRSVIQVSLSVTLMEGDHTSETATIDIEGKKISVIGKGRTESSIETGALSSSSSAAGALFSVSTGRMSLLHIKVDCNSNSSSSPNVVVLSGGSGSLSLDDVVITTSVSSVNAIYSSVLKVPLSQLSMIGVEITKKNISKSLFSELDQSFSVSSFVLFLSLIILGDSVLENVKAKNVKFTSGDGVVAAKAVEAGKSFAMRSTRAKEWQN
ncbi:uncharacterized protein MONOS_14570 [Monocercomonoides exilis]|uniref:uncharacterized protein n=1 Tax=Monocercomonoides exilis TaxID=2049356 RepID=UPI00355938DD|nr:hypothetical protein MONOS_14570 [Monocercomonoides exilis]|eukprot:MONOS_14570.1-p1 / transcript=MONOS_14570.1 / gene=MONOS_14570 / organism=Monocercomonoides_exilis_PA203 / gene_product=unspecified product / transcript_product=unspecified product / location=Mono_scaffold01025:18599-19675(-) / protein_length=359 / sequence_SO=supercontig / SO=protein_coding / is_pseudo=false